MSDDDLPDGQTHSTYAAELGRAGALYSPSSARAWGETISTYGYDNVMKVVKSLRKIHAKPVSLLYVQRQLAKDFPDVKEPAEAPAVDTQQVVAVAETKQVATVTNFWDEKAAIAALSQRGAPAKLAKLMDCHVYRLYEWKSEGIPVEWREKLKAAIASLPELVSVSPPVRKPSEPKLERKPRASNDDLATATELLEVAVHLRQDGNSHWKAIGRIGARLVQKALGEA